jgi:hypothetical protein
MCGVDPDVRGAVVVDDASGGGGLMTELTRRDVLRAGGTGALGDASRYSIKPLPDAVAGKIGDLLADCPVRTAAENGSMWSLGC